MNISDKEQELLENRRLIVLHETIEHETYELFAYAALRFPSDQITVWCKSNGGDCRSAEAIAGLIKMHGDFCAVLIGPVMSAAVTIFAACQTRYIAPTGTIGLHTSSIGGEDRGDTISMRHAMEELDHTDNFQAQCLAEASNKPASEWLALIQSAAHRPCKIITADRLLVYELGKPMADYKLPEYTYEAPTPSTNGVHS